ncbi:hypothetical protein VTL71DRAFT_504, partial [Oculimacula yallundae]
MPTPRSRLAANSTSCMRLTQIKIAFPISTLESSLQCRCQYRKRQPAGYDSPFENSQPKPRLLVFGFGFDRSIMGSVDSVFIRVDLGFGSGSGV